jgi:hypothetical protein
VPTTSSCPMKSTYFARALIALLLVGGSDATALADLTIVQKVEVGSTPGEMTIRIKGDKLRVDPAPQVSMITDNKTGDTVTLMHNEKKAVRMSGEKMKAAAEMVSKFTGATPAGSRSTFTSLGRKEQVNGISTDLYTIDTAVGKATYYIAPNYPDAAAILKEMQSAQPAALADATTHMPDFRNLPGVPIKIEMDAQNRHIVMTLVSIKRDPIPDADFVVPSDYSEMKMPEIFGSRKAPGQPASAPKTTP